MESVGLQVAEIWIIQNEMVSVDILQYLNQELYGDTVHYLDQHPKIHLKLSPLFIHVEVLRFRRRLVDAKQKNLLQSDWSWTVLPSFPRIIELFRSLMEN